jgi:single-stranded DNA-binding protein
MANNINLVGYIQAVDKTYTNDDGSKTMFITVATKTTDPKRQEGEKTMDFFKVKVYLKAGSKLSDYLIQGKNVFLTGSYHFSYKDDKPEYFNISCSSYDITLLNDRAPVDGSARQGSKPAAAVPQATPEPAKADRW